MIDTVVTTIRNYSSRERQLGMELAAALKTSFVARNDDSLENIMHKYEVENVLVVTKKGPVVYTPGGEFFFHLSMAELRIKNLKNGKHDHMVDAMALTQGMSVLDCTLGLATDAIVASFTVGDAGRIVGLESSPPIALITQYGVTCYNAADEEMNRVLRRIKVKKADYYQCIGAIPDHSFDIVYFDPMFRYPVKNSSNMKPLRFLADDRPLHPDIIKDACRIARQRVVVKELRGSSEFKRLGLTTAYGGKYSSISYGVVVTGG